MLARLGLAVGGGLRLRKSAGVVVEAARGSGRVAGATAGLCGTAPKVGVCVRVSTPVVLGLLRPMILLPAAMATGLSTEELAVILAHELRPSPEIRPHVHLDSRGLEAVLFFHPAAWWLTRRVDREREHCCDDLVVRAGHDRVLYSATLVHVAELCLASARPLAASAPAIDGHRRSAPSSADRAALERPRRTGRQAQPLGCPGNHPASGVPAGPPPRSSRRRMSPSPPWLNPDKFPPRSPTPRRGGTSLGRRPSGRRQGKPLRFVTVGICRKDAHLMRPFVEHLVEMDANRCGRAHLPCRQIKPPVNIRSCRCRGSRSSAVDPPDQLPGRVPQVCRPARQASVARGRCLARFQRRS